MTIDFQTSGGIAYFPGRAAPVRIDADALGSEERRALADAVAGARFFERGAGEAAPGPVRDAFTYRITIADGGRRKTMTVSDPIEDPALATLVHRLRGLAAAARAGAQGPGPTSSEGE